MKRIALTDGSGRWFDGDKATYYEEETYHDGSNYISKATGQQWSHQGIYITAGGLIILHTWSNYHGVTDTNEVISEEDAAAWFTKQEFDDDNIPTVLLKFVAEYEIE